MTMNASDSLVPTVDPEWDPCSNDTEAWQWVSSLLPSYLGLLSVVGLVGNGLVLCVLCLQKKSCTVADVYLGNLAAADLVMMSCLPFWAVNIAQEYQWVFGEILCKLVNVAISMNYICSVGFLVLVSVDRYLALVRPMNSSRLRSVSWAKRICVGVWGLGFLFTLPTLLFRKVEYFEDLGVHACILEYPHLAWRLQSNVTKNVLGFLIPVMVVTYCTRHIVSVLKDRKASRLAGVRTERKATDLVLAVWAVFLICWTPYQVMRFLDTLYYLHSLPGCLWEQVLDIGIQLSTYLAYSNSAVNPFLFVIVGKHFRRRAKEVFGKTLNPWSRGTTYLTVSFTSVHRLNEKQRISVETIDKSVLRRIDL